MVKVDFLPSEDKLLVLMVLYFMLPVLHYIYTFMNFIFPRKPTAKSAEIKNTGVRLALLALRATGQLRKING